MLVSKLRNSTIISTNVVAEAPKLIHSAPANHIYIPDIEEYDGTMREALVKSYDEIVPVLALDPPIRLGYVDEDEFGSTHEYVVERLKTVIAEDSQTMPSDYHFFWSAVILVAALLTCAGYYTHQSYGLSLSPDLWDDFMVTIEETVEETGEMDEQNFSDYIENVLLKGTDNEKEESDTIAKERDEEDEKLINRSKIMLSSPLEEDIGSPRPFDMERDEMSPLNLSTLSDEIESSLSIEELKLNDESEVQNLDPFTNESTHELEVVATEYDRERTSIEQHQRADVMAKISKNSKYHDTLFHMFPTEASVPETVKSVIQNMATRGAQTEELSYVSTSSPETKKLTDADVIGMTSESSLDFTKVVETNFNSKMKTSYEAEVGSQSTFNSSHSNDFIEEVESHLILEQCSESGKEIETDINKDSVLGNGFSIPDFLQCDDENTPVEEASQSLLSRRLSMEKMAKEDRVPLLSHTSNSLSHSFESLPISPDKRVPSSGVPFDEPPEANSRVLKDQTNNTQTNVSPSKIPLCSSTKPHSYTMTRGSPTPKRRRLPQISDAVLKYFFESDGSDGEDFLCSVFGDDPDIKFNIDTLSSLTKEEIEDIIRIYIGKETSHNWSERYAKLDVLIGNTRLHLPEKNYDYFQEKIGERLDDIFSMIRTTRSKLLGKIIIFARDLVFFGSEIALSSETYVNLIHALLSLTRESQSSKHIQKLTTKSLCVMSQALTPSSFIDYFETIFENILKNRKMKGEKYACLFMIKFSILMNRDKFTREQLVAVVKKLIPLIPQLSIDPFQKTRSEIVELYLILTRLNVPYEELNAFYQGLTTFLKSQVGPPAIPTDP
jgi:hypothetical protein